MNETIENYIKKMEDASLSIAKITEVLSKKEAEEKKKNSKQIFKKAIEISAKRFNQEIEDESNISENSKQKKYELIKKYDGEVDKINYIYNIEIEKLLLEKENVETQRRLALLDRKKAKDEKKKYIAKCFLQKNKIFMKEEEFVNASKQLKKAIVTESYVDIPYIAARIKELEAEKEEILLNEEVCLDQYKNELLARKSKYKNIKSQIKNLDKYILALEKQRQIDIENLGMSKENNIAFADKSIIRKMQRALTKMLMTNKVGEKKFNKEVIENIYTNLEQTDEKIIKINENISNIYNLAIKNIDNSYLENKYNKENSFENSLLEVIDYANEKYLLK